MRLSARPLAASAVLALLATLGGPSPSVRGLEAATAGTRLRGAMIAPDPRSIDLEDLSAWGANVARLPLVGPHHPEDEGAAGPRAGATAGRDDWFGWIDAALDRFQGVTLPAFQRLDLPVILNLHTLPGGLEGGGEVQRLFRDPLAQQRLRGTWRRIATRLRGQSHVVGYDIANEPRDTSPAAGCLDWPQLALAVLREIRAVDAGVRVYVESPNASASALVRLVAVDQKVRAEHLGPVHYSIHMYWPLAYTHQLVYPAFPTVNPYPGGVRGNLDAPSLRQNLQPAVDFVATTGARLLVGEFSAARWAPGGEGYVRDLIAIFEQQGWDWIYHSFRGAHTWEPDLPVDMVPCSDPASCDARRGPTARSAVLRSAFARNP